MKLSKWAKKNGISYLTAWRWAKSGKLPVGHTVMPSGTILVDDCSVFENPKTEVVTRKTAVIYARVSSNDKKDDLKRQVERLRDFCTQNGWVVEKEVSEIASGLNDKRKKLIDIVKSKPQRIVVEHKDRLTRFGFNYFEEILPLLGTELIVANRDAVEENDLIKDLVAIITSFCCRIYGQRRGKNKAERLTKNLVKDESADGEVDK